MKRSRDRTVQDRLSQSLPCRRCGSGSDGSQPAIFMAEQEQLLDKKRQYEVVLNSNRGAFVGFLFSFPKIEMDKIQILTSDQTEEAFKSKKTDEIKLAP
jgi:hypothetical protein